MTTPVNSATTNRAYQRPSANAPSQRTDIERVAAALNAIDADVAALLLAMAAKAPLDSPVLVNNPTAPTQPASDNSQRLATTAYVKAALNALINSAPGTLDTLGEIAAQLANDQSAVAALTTLVNAKANASDMASALAGKAALADLASTAATKGASLIGIQDAAGLIAGTTVEAALAEIAASIRPLASEAEAAAGTDNTKAMTPLRTAQAIAALAAGKLKQIVTANYTSAVGLTSAIPFDGTLPQITEGTEILSAAITPTSATSRIVITASVGPIDVSALTRTTVALFRSGTSNCLAARSHYHVGAAHILSQANIVYEHLSGTTTARTYSVRVGPDGGTMYPIGNGAGIGGRGTLVIMEIEP
jgi:hypothetical protein